MIEDRRRDLEGRIETLKDQRDAMLEDVRLCETGVLTVGENDKDRTAWVEGARQRSEAITALIEAYERDLASGYD